MTTTMRTALVKVAKNVHKVLHADDYRSQKEFAADLRGNGYRVLKIWNGYIPEEEAAEWHFLNRKMTEVNADNTTDTAEAQAKVEEKSEDEKNLEMLKDMYETADPEMKSEILGRALDLQSKIENAKAQTETEVKTLGEEVSESDAKFEIGKTYFVMHFLTHQTDTITVEARTAQMLTGTTSEGTRKYRIFTNVRGEFVQIGKDEDNNGIYIYAKNEFTPANVENSKQAAIETAAQLGISTGEESETKVEETTETKEATAEATSEVKKSRNYSINPDFDDEDRPIKYNHINIVIEEGILKIDGLFECWKPETAYRRFTKIMAQAAVEVPELEGWDEWEPAKKLTFDETEKVWLNENGDMIFDTKYSTNCLNVDVNEDSIYIWGTFYTTAEAYMAAHPEEPVFDYDAEATVEAQAEPDKFTATQITFPNGYEGEPTVEVSKTFDNLDDAAKFIADDNPIIGETLADLKPAYDGYYFGSIFFAGWKITRGGKEIASCDYLGYLHGDCEVCNFVDKCFCESEFEIPDAPGFLADEYQDDYKEFRPKVEIVKAVFENSEALDVKKILAPLANQAQVELGDLTTENFDKSNGTFTVNIEVKGSINAIEKFKALLNDRQPEPPTDNPKKFIKAALDNETERNSTQAATPMFEVGEKYRLCDFTPSGKRRNELFKVIKRGKAFVTVAKFSESVNDFACQDKYKICASSDGEFINVTGCAGNLKSKLFAKDIYQHTTVSNTEPECNQQVATAGKASAVTTLREKYALAKFEVKFEESDSNAKLWFENTHLLDGYNTDNISWRRTTKAKANETLAQFGITTGDYIAEYNREIEEIRERNAANFKSQNSKTKLPPRAPRVNPFAPKPDDKPNTESDPDDFTAELAKLTAVQADAKKILDIKQAELIKVQDAHQAAQDAWSETNQAINNLYRTKAKELSDKLLPLRKGVLEIKTQDGFNPLIDTATVSIDFDKGKFAIHGDCSEKLFFELARYDTPAQVETAINGLKATDALGGDKFTFPANEELNASTADKFKSAVKTEIKAAQKIVRTKRAKLILARVNGESTEQAQHELDLAYLRLRGLENLIANSEEVIA